MIRRALGRVLRGVLLAVTARLPPARVIGDRAGTSPYLSRWYLLGGPTMPDGSPPFNAAGNPKEGINWGRGARTFDLFIHRFHRSDDDGALHNHPWSWACSLVLAGGYTEERREGSVVVRRVVEPLSLNFIRGEDFHRVDLIESDAWSLFFAGPKVSSGGVWERQVPPEAVTPWRAYINGLRAEGSRKTVD